eukprot:14485495-Alexandrium_andersonii.AAC.1
MLASTAWSLYTIGACRQGGPRFGRFGLRHVRFRRSIRFDRRPVAQRKAFPGGFRPPDPPRSASGAPAG